MLIDWVAVINLKCRADRRALFFQHFNKLPHWPFPRPVLWQAVDGRRLPAPRTYRIGPPPHYPYTPGTWGNLMTMLQLFNHVLQEEYEMILIFEDDAQILSPNFAEDFWNFWHALPSDWDLLCLHVFPQHQTPEHQEPVNPWVVKAKTLLGTVAVIYPRRTIRTIYDHLWGATCSYDPLVNGMIRNQTLQVYRPTAMLVRHGGGLSETSQQVQAGEDWHPPVILLDSPPQVAQELQAWGWHIGTPPLQQDREPFAQWLSGHWEAAKQKGNLPAIWPKTTLPEWLEDLPYTFYPIRASSAQEAEEKLLQIR